MNEAAANAPACPGAGDAVPARVATLDGPLRLRSGPSLDAEVVAYLDPETVVDAFPTSLDYDGSRWWWVAVIDPQSGQCAYGAAGFLRDDRGALDRGLQAIDFELPSTGTWSGALHETTFWWTNPDFLGGLGIRIEETGGLEAHIEELETEFAAIGYGPDEERIIATNTEGADGAIRVVPSLSASGDSAVEQLIAEIDGATITFLSTIYVEHLTLAPESEMKHFLDSVRIDREAFVSAREP